MDTNAQNSHAHDSLLTQGVSAQDGRNTDSSSSHARDHLDEGDTQDKDNVQDEKENTPLSDDYSRDFSIQEELSENAEGMLLTSLPEVALVHIMEYLTLKERYYLSMTCRLFYDLFSHPQLWQVAHIHLLTQGMSSTTNRMRWRLQSVMHQTMAEIVRRFSHLFQHLSLVLYGHVQPFDDDCRNLLEHLNKECRLESLSLKLGHLASSDDQIRQYSNRRSDYTDLPLIIGLIKKATRLKKLNIASWPLNIEMADGCDIFKALVSNERMKNLESLNLFYVDLKQDPWTERIPQLPSVEITKQLVSHFQNLSYLALRSPMLNDEVFMILASNKRCKLSTLQILIMYSRDSVFLEGYKVPEISAKAWLALKTASPELKVEYLVLTRIPSEHLALMLKPEVPLSSLSILNYGRCDQELIETLTEKYKTSFEKFVSLCDSSDCDEALIHMVSACAQLNHIVYHGDVHYKTVMKLAQIVKDSGLEYTCFDFKEKNIKTSQQDGLEDEDTVVARDEERQEYYLVGLRSWHQDQEEHNRSLSVMKDLVSQCLGYTWNPS